MTFLLSYVNAKPHWKYLLSAFLRFFVAFFISTNSVTIFAYDWFINITSKYIRISVSHFVSTFLSSPWYLKNIPAINFIFCEDLLFISSTISIKCVFIFSKYFFSESGLKDASPSPSYWISSKYHQSLFIVFIGIFHSSCI